jgi:hypothetical protein
MKADKSSAYFLVQAGFATRAKRLVGSKLGILFGRRRERRIGMVRMMDL